MNWQLRQFGVSCSVQIQVRPKQGVVHLCFKVMWMSKHLRCLSWNWSFHHFALVVSHGLKSDAEVSKLQSSVTISVESLYPVGDISLHDIASGVKLLEELTQVVVVYSPMRVLVNSSEDRQDGVVELGLQLLLHQFNYLQGLDLPVTQHLSLTIQLLLTFQAPS